MQFHRQLDYPTEFEQEVATNVFAKSGHPTYRLVGVDYDEQENFTTAFTLIRNVVNGKLTGGVHSIGVSKRRATDHYDPKKGHTYALVRALKRVIE